MSDLACCNRCGQKYPRHPGDPAHVEVHGFQWTGGYRSVFPGDLTRLTVNLCELCTMVLCSELRVVPAGAEVWVSGVVYRVMGSDDIDALRGLCLGNEDVALIVASTTDRVALATHTRFAIYLAHRRAFGDPKPDLTQRVAKALSATIDADGSAWRTAEGTEDPRAALAAFGVPVERARELREVVRQIAEAAK